MSFCVNRDTSLVLGSRFASLGSVLGLILINGVALLDTPKGP
jgi:hypothetical protein